MWDAATKEFGAAYVALLKREEAMQHERDRKHWEKR